MIAFAGELTAELGHPVQVNAYVTPPSSRGFSAHYDIHDVFVLQVAGEKRWIVHEPVHEWPLRTQPWTQHRADVERAVESPPILDAVLRPGDALYLPRGFLHAAEALGDVSVHLTVGIHVVTRRALLDALLAEAEDEPELRRALPVGVDLADPEVLADELSATVEALSSRFRDLDPDAAARRLGKDLAAASRPSPISPLAQVEASAHVESAMRIQLRVGLPIRVDIDDRVATLHHQGRRLELDAALGDALALIATGESRAVGSLPGDEAAVAELVRTLLVNGVVGLAD